MKVIIVGAGISGLTAAYYATKKGHDVTVYERCANPGGVSTNWKRKGYLFEGGIHWLVGSSKRLAPFHKIYKETGALQENNPIIYKDPVFVYKRDGVTLHLWRDLKRMAEELADLAPEDKDAILRLCWDVRLISMFYGMPQSLKEHVTRVWYVFLFLRTLILSVFQSTDEYLNRFQNKYIREMFSSIINVNQNALSLLGTLAGYHLDDNGFPKHGSARMAGNMEQTAKEMGCQFHYNKTVEKVCTEKGRVKGVIVDGELIVADRVIVTIDTRTAVEKLMNTPLKDKWARKLVKKEIESEQCMFFSAGVSTTLKHYPKTMRLHLDNLLEIGGQKYDIMWLNNYSHEDGYAPEGCTSLTMLFQGDSYDFWKEAKRNGTYREEKARVTEEIKAALVRLIPECEGKIEVTDLATPLTYERYCGNHRGGYMTVWRARTMPPMIPTKCSIKGLIFAGQRTFMNGGLPIAAQSGKRAARAL